MAAVRGIIPESCHPPLPGSRRRAGRRAALRAGCQPPPPRSSSPCRGRANPAPGRLPAIPPGHDGDRQRVMAWAGSGSSYLPALGHLPQLLEQPVALPLQSVPLLRQPAGTGRGQGVSRFGDKGWQEVAMWGGGGNAMPQGLRPTRPSPPTASRSPAAARPAPAPGWPNLSSGSSSLQRAEPSARRGWGQQRQGQLQLHVTPLLPVLRRELATVSCSS